MPGQDRSGQIVEPPTAIFATVALAMPLLLVMTVADHRLARTARATNPIRPAMLTDQIVALCVINKRAEVDQFRNSHDNTESVKN